jgi:hypothetical protein
VPPGRLALPDEQQRDDQVQSLHPKHCSHSERSVALERPSPHMDGVHQGILSVTLEDLLWAPLCVNPPHRRAHLRLLPPQKSPHLCSLCIMCSSEFRPTGVLCSRTPGSHEGSQLPTGRSA